LKNLDIKFLSFIIILIFSNQEGNAQSKNKLIIAPINFIDPINPSIQIGYERMITDNYSAQIEAGILTKRSLLGYTFIHVVRVSDLYWNTYSGYKLRGEFKKYFNKSPLDWGRSYLAVELFYTKKKANTNNSFLVTDSTFQYTIERPEGYDAYDDWFVNDTKKMGVNIKYGWNEELTDHLSIEYYFGVGIAMQKSKHYGRENLMDEFLDPVFSYFDKEGSNYYLSLPLNIKLSYAF